MDQLNPKIKKDYGKSSNEGGTTYSQVSGLKTLATSNEKSLPNDCVSTSTNILINEMASFQVEEMSSC
jgi:hypothetical protein